MKPNLILFAFGMLCASAGISQNCASAFTATPANYSEFCNPTGAAAYSIYVTAFDDSTLVFQGLWEEAQAFDTAHVNCANMTFVLPRQPLSTFFEIEGVGSMNSGVNLAYRVFSNGSSNAVDSCAGIYSPVVGVMEPELPQLHIFPNPAHDHLTLRLSGGLTHSPWTYLVLDTQGRTVAKGVLGASGQADLGLEHHAKGVYQIVLYNGSGQAISRNLSLR